MLTLQLVIIIIIQILLIEPKGIINTKNKKINAPLPNKLD